MAEVELCGHATVACVGVLHDHGLRAPCVGHCTRVQAHLHTGYGHRSTRAALLTIRSCCRRWRYVCDDRPFLISSTCGSLLHRLTRHCKEDMAAVAVALCGGSDGAADAASRTWSRPGLRAWRRRGCGTPCTPIHRQPRRPRPDMGAVAELRADLARWECMRLHPSASAGGGSGKGGGAAGHYRVRNFALFGIDEESATGTSNCALVCAGTVAARGTPLSSAKVRRWMPHYHGAATRSGHPQRHRR